MGFMALVFDPKTVKSSATRHKPKQFPAGIECVLVNGRIVVDQGQHTGLLPGRACATAELLPKPSARQNTCASVPWPRSARSRPVTPAAFTTVPSLPEAVPTCPGHPHGIRTGRAGELSASSRRVTIPWNS